MNESKIKKLFYHGSPTPNIKVLEPRLDPRLGIKGIFVDEESYAPMLFSLLPIRDRSNVNLTTKAGKFIEGTCVAEIINDEGWLYTIEADRSTVKECESRRYYLTASVPVMNSRKVTKKEVLALGWKVTIKSV